MRGRVFGYSQKMMIVVIKKEMDGMNKENLWKLIHDDFFNVESSSY